MAGVPGMASCGLPVQLDASGHIGRRDVGRGSRAGLQRAVGAAAHSGATGFAVLGDGQALAVAVHICQLPCHGPGACRAGGQFSRSLLIEDVGSGEGVSGDVQAGRVAAIVRGRQRAGQGAHVAAAHSGVLQRGLNDALFQLVGADPVPQIALDRDGVAVALGGSGHVGVLDLGFAGGRSLPVELDRDDVPGADVGSDVHARAGAPADPAGVVDFEGHIPCGNLTAGGPDDSDIGPRDLHGCRLSHAVLVSLNGHEVPVGKDHEVVGKSGNGGAGW